MKKFVYGLGKAGDKISAWFCYFSMLTIFIMMVLITLDVIMNKLGKPIAGIYEVSQVLLSTLVFASWAYTQSVKGHIHVVMFVSKFPQKLRFICFGLTSILSTVVMGFAAYAVTVNIMERYNTGEMTGTLMIPYWPFVIFEAIAFILMTVLLLADALKAVMAIRDKEIAEDVQSSWV